MIVPAALGLAAPTFHDGRAIRAGCRSDVWTTDPTGVVHVRGTHTLGLVFAVWGQRLDAGHLASFSGRVSLFVNGRRSAVDARTLLLRNGDEIVLEVGGYVPPHASYRFPM